MRGRFSKRKHLFGTNRTWDIHWGIGTRLECTAEPLLRLLLLLPLWLIRFARLGKFVCEFARPSWPRYRLPIIFSTSWHLFVVSYLDTLLTDLTVFLNTPHVLTFCFQSAWNHHVTEIFHIENISERNSYESMVFFTWRSSAARILAKRTVFAEKTKLNRDFRGLQAGSFTTVR